MGMRLTNVQYRMHSTIRDLVSAPFPPLCCMKEWKREKERVYENSGKMYLQLTTNRADVSYFQFFFRSLRPIAPTSYTRNCVCSLRIHLCVCTRNNNKRITITLRQFCWLNLKIVFRARARHAYIHARAHTHTQDIRKHAVHLNKFVNHSTRIFYIKSKWKWNTSLFLNLPHSLSLLLQLAPSNELNLGSSYKRVQFLFHFLRKSPDTFNKKSTNKQQSCFTSITREIRTENRTEGKKAVQNMSLMFM